MLKKKDVLKFINKLPIALERDDIRIVHAAWDQKKIEQIRNLDVGKIKHYHDEWERQVYADAKRTGLLERYIEEKEKWKVEIESEHTPPPFLHAVADYETLRHVHNPIKVLTSGIETRAEQAFFSGNRWRFSDRQPWWNDYDHNTPVVIGHYWRLLNPRPDQPQSRYSLLFKELSSASWHGSQRTVFCVDYSVGARWRNRKDKLHPTSRFKLGALQWPEKRLVFDCGESMTTENQPISVITSGYKK